MPADLLARSTVYHRALPERLRRYLNGRGISDAVIDLHQLGWDGNRITIPILDRQGVLVFFKLAKDPDDTRPGPKIITSPGGHVELYGWERVLARPCRLIVCEGEFDRLVLESHGIAAVTSTGGAGSFRPEWVEDLSAVPELYLCFDRDDAGGRGALRAAQLLPHAKIVALPDEVGPAGDITDYFVRLGHSREDFEELLAAATPAPARAEMPISIPRPVMKTMSELKIRIEAVKAAVPITDLAKRYVILQRSGATLRGRCPFHEDHVPSFVVYPSGSNFYCFGCGRHGDVITLYVAMERVPFRQALDELEDLARDYGRPPAAAA